MFENGYPRGLQNRAKIARRRKKTASKKGIENESSGTQNEIQNLPKIKYGESFAASGVDFGGPGARFLKPRGSIWEHSGTMFSRFLPRMPRLPRTPRTPAKTRPRSQMRQEWVGGGAPPPGGLQLNPQPPFLRRCVACEM